MRRTLLVALLVLILAAAAVGVYFFFFNGKAPVVTVDQGPAFGTSGDYVPQAGEVGSGEIGDTESGAGEVVAPRLTKITPGPVAFGTVAFSVSERVPVEGAGTSTASTTLRTDTEIRYLERASGNAYGYRTEARTLTRLSNRTLPGVYEASWVPDGSRVFARFIADNSEGVEVLETYALPIGGGEGGYFLAPNISEVAVRSTSSVATLIPNSSGSLATVSAPDGSNPRTLFTSPLSALQLVPSGTGYAAYTNASAQLGGYGFQVTSSGAFDRLVGPFRGLAMLPSPSGKQVLYTYLSGSALKTELLEVASRVSTPIPLGALAEKCVFAPDEKSVYCAVPRAVSGTLPDDWYQGAVSFSDRIWKIDLVARVAVLVIDPLNAGGVAIDAVNLSVDAKAAALVFINKKDGSLWVYDL